MLIALVLTSLASASEPQTLTGDLLVAVDDFVDGDRSTTSLTFRDDEAGFVALADAEWLAELGCDRLKITGTFADDGAFWTDDAACLEEEREPEEGGDPERGAASLVAHDTLVIRIDMLNATVGGATIASLDSLLFGTGAFTSVHHFTDLSTFGAEGLQGVVITANIAATNNGLCSVPDQYTWAALADAEATSQGHPPGSYDRVVYVLPDGVGCPWGGRAIQGGKWSWIRDYTDPHTYAHELGHNRGLGHANGTWQCALYEYFDRSDAMGIAYHRFNAPHLDQGGWLDPGDVVTVVASGVHTLEALHHIADGLPPRVLKIWDPVAGEFVYVSLREATGPYEAGMTPDIDGTISIHRFLDPGSPTSTRPTRLVDNLSPGDSYWFSDGTVQIEVLSISGAAADVEVTVHPCYMAVPVCYPPPPPPTGCGAVQ